MNTPFNVCVDAGVTVPRFQCKTFTKKVRLRRHRAIELLMPTILDVSYLQLPPAVQVQLAPFDSLPKHNSTMIDIVLRAVTVNEISPDHHGDKLF